MEKWLWRKIGSMTYITCQFLLGHSCREVHMINTYSAVRCAYLSRLSKMGPNENRNQHCRDANNNIKEKIFTPSNIVESMLESEDYWMVINETIKYIIINKQIAMKYLKWNKKKPSPSHRLNRIASGQPNRSNKRKRDTG